MGSIVECAGWSWCSPVVPKETVVRDSGWGFNPSPPGGGLPHSDGGDRRTF